MEKAEVTDDQRGGGFWTRGGESPWEGVTWLVKEREGVAAGMPVIQEGKKQGEGQEEDGGWKQIIKYLLGSVILLCVFHALATLEECDYSNFTSVRT